MPLSFTICLIGFGIFQIAAFLVYAVWIPRFVENHGVRTASPATHVLLGSGWLRDWRQAQAIRRRLGVAPWFLKAFEMLECAAVLFFIAGVASALWT